MWTLAEAQEVDEGRLVLGLFPCSIVTAAAEPTRHFQKQRRRSRWSHSVLAEMHLDGCWAVVDFEEGGIIRLDTHHMPVGAGPLPSSRAPRKTPGAGLSSHRNGLAAALVEKRDSEI